jgi:hypothetical protein
MMILERTQLIIREEIDKKEGIRMAKRVKAIDVVKQQLELYLSNPSLVMKQKGWTKAEYENEVALLEQKIILSKRGKSSRAKGGNYERTIAKKFKDKLDVELKRTPMSGGFAKGSSKASEFRGDIITVDDSIDFKLHIEAKDHKSWSLPKWILQAEEDCPEGRIPVVVFHRRQLNEKGKRVQESGDYVCLSLDNFLDIVDRDKVIVPKHIKTKKKLKK